MSARSRFITHAGETKTIKEWANSTGLSHQLIHQRIKAGWSIERALNPERDSRGSRRGGKIAQQRIFSDAIDMIYQDMKAHQRALHRTIRACLSSIEEQAASQRLTLERMLEERTRLPADVGPGVVINFDHLLSDRLSSTAQDRR